MSWTEPYRRAYHAAYYRAHQEQLCATERVRGRASRRALRDEVLAAYSEGALACSCCGETFEPFLTIDHIGGGGSSHRREVHNVYFDLKRRGFPAGFRVLCLNCNFRAHRVEGECDCPAGRLRVTVAAA